MAHLYEAFLASNRLKLLPDTSLVSSMPASWVLQMMPLIDANKRLLDSGILNSDLLKGARHPDLRMALLSQQLAKNVDFGLGPRFAELVKRFGVSQASWISRTTPLLEGLDLNIYPDNLAEIDELMIREVRPVVMLDGIALYGIPRPSVAEAIIRADDTASRRRIIGSRWKAIVVDCRAALKDCDAKSLKQEIGHTLAAIDALEDGHPQAAQALLGTVIDTLVTSYFGEKRRLFTPGRTKTTDAYKRMHMREFIAFAPIWQAYQPFWASQKDRVPTTFSRHATAHTASKKQYSRINTVQGLMIACGILLFLDEQDERAAAA